MRLLVVEDDLMIVRAMRDGLIGAGFAVDGVHDGRSAELALGNGVYDLVVLDLGLPAKHGLTVLVSLRRSGNNVPVIIATARDAVADRIAGLNAGAETICSSPSIWTNWSPACGLCYAVMRARVPTRWSRAPSRWTWYAVS